jgi:tetratricopeptide (TPR) repeat protein
MQPVRRSVWGLVGGLLFVQAIQAQQPTPARDVNSDPATYVNLGIASGERRNLPEALDYFNKAISLDPNYVAAYENRGKLYVFAHRYDEAQADYTKALELNPKDTGAYYSRGVIEGVKNDLDGAINDFNHVLTLDPKYMLALFNRGHAKYLKNDLPGVIADCTQAIALNPAYPFSYYIRGLAERAQHNLPAATADFQKAADIGIADGVLWTWVTEAEKYQRAVADAHLSASLPKLLQNPEAAFDSQIANFLLGKMIAEALITEGKKGNPGEGHLGSAYFFIGISKRLAGDANGAQEAFQNAMTTADKGAEEYIESQRELSPAPKK